MIKKYVIFKDDDVGKDLNSLKKWINVVLKIQHLYFFLRIEKGKRKGIYERTK